MVATLCPPINVETPQHATYVTADTVYTRQAGGGQPNVGRREGLGTSGNDSRGVAEKGQATDGACLRQEKDATPVRTTGDCPLDSHSIVDKGTDHSHIVRTHFGIGGSRLRQELGQQDQVGHGGAGHPIRHEGVVSATTGYNQGRDSEGSCRRDTTQVGEGQGRHRIPLHITGCRPDILAVGECKDGQKEEGGRDKFPVPQKRPEWDVRGDKDNDPIELGDGGGVLGHGEGTGMGDDLPTEDRCVYSLAEEIGRSEGGYQGYQEGGGSGGRESSHTGGGTELTSAQGCCDTAHIHKAAYRTREATAQGSADGPTRRIRWTDDDEASSIFSDSPTVEEYYDPPAPPTGTDSHLHIRDADRSHRTKSHRAGGSHLEHGDGGDGDPADRLNMIAMSMIDVDKVLGATPCPVTALALRLHFEEEMGRIALRKMVHMEGRKGMAGTTTQGRFRNVVRKVIAIGNLRTIKRSELGHSHAIFLRLKSNGRDYRMLVDASDKDHPNAYNSRLPRPPKPPAFLPVVLIILIVMQGDQMGVDDIQTAFNQMGPLSQPMSKALGVSTPLESGSMLCAEYRVVPQGGTWSPVVMQGTTLTMAHETEWFPQRPHLEPVKRRDEMYTTRPADWVQAAVRNGKIVHVDDVVTAQKGSAELLDRRRAKVREHATEKYGVVWKEATPSSQEGDALGVNYQLRDKTWSPIKAWGHKVEMALQNTEHVTAETDEKLAGCVVWMHTVLSLPDILSQRIQQPEVKRMAVNMTRSRAEYVNGVPTMANLTRPHSYEHVIVTDAMGQGWAGASSLGYTDADKWYWCERAQTYSPHRCCGGAKTVTCPSEDMYMGEAIASVWTTLEAVRSHGGERGDGAEKDGVMMITDSDIWNKVVRRGYSGDRVLGALAMLIHMTLASQPSVAHVAGTENPADEPSRCQRTFRLTDIPPHTSPYRSALAGTRICGEVERELIAAIRLPCPFAVTIARMDRMRRGHHVKGCRCTTRG